MDEPDASPAAESSATQQRGLPQGVSAQVAPQSRLDKILGFVPRALSSHAHIIFLGTLGTYLVLLPLQMVIAGVSKLTRPMSDR